MNKIDLWNTTFEKFLPLLDGQDVSGPRAEGFRSIFDSLLSKKSNNFNIVETGTVRVFDSFFEGCSTLLFSEFINIFEGSLITVDINLEVQQNAKKEIQSSNVSFVCENSLTALRKINLDEIDLFYLDSFDVDFNNDRKSAGHHFTEFKIIEPFLKDCILAIDDNIINSNGERSGKGRVIYEYLKDQGILPIYDNYTLVYKF